MMLAPLQRKLQKLVLAEDEKEVIEVCLGKRGEYNGAFDYIRRAYFFGQADSEQIERIYWNFKDARNRAVKKLARFFELEPAYRNLLLEIEPFYKDVLANFSGIDGLVSEIKRFKGHSGQKRFSVFEQDLAHISKEDLERAISVLPDAEQELVKWRLGWNGQEISTCNAYAEKMGIARRTLTNRLSSIRDKIFQEIGNERR